METTLYDEPENFDKMTMMQKKRSHMKLELNVDAPKAKHAKKGTTIGLTTPDLNILKLASPELERLIINQNGIVTTTPTPTQLFYPTKCATVKQEEYARGFIEALNKLHQKTGQNGEILVSTPTEIATALTANGLPVPETISVKSPIFSSSTSALFTDLTNATVQSTNGSDSSVFSDKLAESSSNNPSPAPSSRGTPPVITQIITRPSTADSVVSVQNISVPFSTINTNRRINLVGSDELLMDNTLLPKEEPQTVPCLNNDYVSLSNTQSLNPAVLNNKHLPGNSGLNISVTCSTPPLSPIDMESQEAHKLERKRARNRLAARKCRTRKLERISKLEEHVSELKGQNSTLQQNASSLREQVSALKRQIMDHMKQGCNLMVPTNTVNI